MSLSDFVFFFLVNYLLNANNQYLSDIFWGGSIPMFSAIKQHEGTDVLYRAEENDLG